MAASHQYALQQDSTFQRWSIKLYRIWLSNFGQKCAIKTSFKLTTIYVKTEHFTPCFKDNDTTKTANIKIVVLQSWHIYTKIRTIAMFHLKCKIVPTCDFCDGNPLKGFKINSQEVMGAQHVHFPDGF